jgi:cyanophycinase
MPENTHSEKRTPASQRHGQIMPIGGAEDLDPSRDGSILHEFVRLAGGKRAHIAVIPTASADPEQSGAGYKKLFEKIGVNTAEVLNIDQREEANSPQAVELLQRSTGIFITGGDQARLVSLLTGTLVMETVRVSNQNGSVVAGTSAGASILSAHMMVPGSLPGLQTSDASPRKGETDLVGGFGLLRDIIIDQHFSQRGRIGRLLEAFAGNPGLLGLGLDENTAAIIDDAATLTVIGCGAATILDGRNATSNYFECHSGEIVSVFDSHIFVLGPGQRFDLATRRPLPPAEA